MFTGASSVIPLENGGEIESLENALETVPVPGLHLFSVTGGEILALRRCREIALCQPGQRETTRVAVRPINRNFFLANLDQEMR